ncbi:MAG: thiol-disulfide isomerase, partial [Bryobacteraceae bacterium]
QCHRSGEIGPMAFSSYKESRPWAKAIKGAVVARKMPPWFADPHYGEFSNNASLSQKDIDTITAWADSGAKEGNPKDAPAPVQFVEGWNVGKPEVVLGMTEEFNVPVDGTIPYKYFAVPTNFTEDRYVQLAEIRPGDRAHVHHVIVSVRYPSKDASLPSSGELTPAALAASRAQGARGIEDSDGRLVGWAPGEAPLMLKPGQAKLVKKGSTLVFQVHYTTNGKPGKDRTSVGLIFSKAPVEKRVITAGAFARKLVIPPGEPNYESTATFPFKDDSHIDSLHPHMHFRGKDMSFRLVYPDGTSKTLLFVPHFDFGWQLTYFLKEPIAAPAGSKLEVVAHHDNSANNKFNPDPTKEVHWGEQTWDEMMIGYLDYTVDKQDLRKSSPQSSGGGK